MDGNPQARPTAAQGNAITRLFGLRGETWMRHANPVSVWTRFAVLPLLVISIWSRVWIGWLCLVPLVVSLVWMMVNPLFFKPPRSTNNWASKGVLGERIFTEADRGTLPVPFRSRIPAVAQAYQGVGAIPLVYGLIVLDPIVAVTGMLIVQGGKLWLIDRMVLLFEAAKLENPEYAKWEY